MTAWETFKEAVSGAAAFFRWREKAGDRANSPAMTANAATAVRQKIADDAAETVAQNDLPEIQKRAAE